MSKPLSLYDVFPENNLLEIVDVGALPLDGTETPYQGLLTSGRARLTAFEPDAAGLTKLGAALGAPHRYLPYFIGDGAPATFYETDYPMTGSLYPPNDAALALYPDVQRFMQRRAHHAVPTQRLDDIADIARIDFLKMDVQGGELSVLQGAQRLLTDTLVVQAEVEFVPLYQGQPLFTDVDGFLRAAGFQFHTFLGMALRFVGPLQMTHMQQRGMN